MRASWAWARPAVAIATGSEALFWNPAGVARGPRELSFGFVSNVPIPVSDLSVGFVVPVPRVITFALSLRYLNDGQQQAIDTGGTQTGTFYPSSITLTLTSAAPFGDRFNVGVNVKLFEVGLQLHWLMRSPGRHAGHRGRRCRRTVSLSQKTHWCCSASP